MRPNRAFDWIVAQLPSRLPCTRYDFVLAFIPVAFLLTVGAASLLGLPQQVALVGWSVAGLVALVDALFIRPPTSGGRVN